MKFARKVVASLVSGMLLSTASYAVESRQVPTGEGFSAGEHAMLGNKVKLYFAADDIGRSADEGRLLHLENGATLSYGDIVSLGDFYGMPSKPIAFGATNADREKTFVTAFEMFSKSDQYKQELQGIISITAEEQEMVGRAVAKGQSVEAIYKKISEDHNRRYNCVTGGGCGREWWLMQGRYLKLAAKDYDHFRKYSLIAYKTGHDLAIKTAMAAHRTQDVKMLEKAYAMNAFASHFLSDRFAAGHMRTPRYALDANVTPSIVGALLSHYMHDEDGIHGLHVHNLRGDHWVAYGDKHYFDKANAEHAHMLHEAMQQSVDEVFSAYKTGTEPSREVNKLIPYPDFVNHDRGHDVAPMFYWDNATKKLYRRSDLSNPYSFNFTTNWWGWSTFLELSRLYGMPHGGLKADNKAT